MSFWEIFALLVTAPIWVPMMAVGLCFIGMAIFVVVGVPVIMAIEAMRK
jgi:hypothetical protein